MALLIAHTSIPHWRTWPAFFLASGHSNAVPRALNSYVSDLIRMTREQNEEHTAGPLCLCSSRAVQLRNVLKCRVIEGSREEIKGHGTG